MIIVILFYVLLVISNIIICRWIWQYYTLRKKLQSISSPNFLPFVGFAWQFMSKAREDRSKWLNDLCLKSKEGMTLIWIGSEPRLIISSPEHAKTILASNTLISKAKSYNLIKPWLGNGLVLSSGDHWLKQRRMLTPAFHFRILEEYAKVMRKKVEIFMECIDNKLSENEKVPINIFEMATNYALDTICEAAMGTNIDSQRKPTNEYVTALHKFSALSMERVYSFWLRSDAIYFHTSKGKEALKCIKIMHDFSGKVLEQKLLDREEKKKSTNANANENDESGARKPKVFLDLLLDESEKADNPLTFQQIREELDTFIFGGHDTTAVSISWTLFALGNAPEIQAKIQNELNKVFGDETTMASTKQLSELKYLDRVIKEILRLYPAAPTTSRCVDKDVMIDGHVIPEGTTITCNFYQIHHNPRVWEDPEKFDPDRFLPENIKSKNPYVYLPFSAGPRNCIGQKFALLELKIVLATILRKWRVSSVLKNDEVKMVQDIILRPYNDKIELYFTPLK